MMAMVISYIIGMYAAIFFAGYMKWSFSETPVPVLAVMFWPAVPPYYLGVLIYSLGQKLRIRHERR